MLTYFAIFCAFAVCAGWLIVRVFEWRQDVLHGPYVRRDPSRRKR